MSINHPIDQKSNFGFMKLYDFFCKIKLKKSIQNGKLFYFINTILHILIIEMFGAYVCEKLFVFL